MADLKIGTGIKITGVAEQDSIIPVTRTSDRILDPGIDQMIQGDPTVADINFTLPDAVSNAGVEFFLKRITNSGNVVILKAGGSDTIEGGVNGSILALINEFIHVYSDGTINWRIKNVDVFSICTMQATAASFTVTTSLVKFNGWDTVVFGTPQKLEGSLTNDRIDIVQFQGPIADGYSISITFDFIYTNNNTVTAQLFVAGSLVGIPVSVNALGTGKPTSITFSFDAGVISTGTIELHVSAENGGSITSINALMRAVRIGH